MRRALAIAVSAYWRFLNDDGWAIASHVALSGITALFPFLIVVTTLAGFFGSKELADEVATLLLEAWPATIAGPLSHEIHAVLTETRVGLLTLGAVLSLYFASSAIEALRVALNRAYGLRDRRSWWLQRIEAIAFVIVGAISLLTIAFLVVLYPILSAIVERRLPQFETLRLAADNLRLGVAALVLAAALILLHKFLPPGRRRLVEILPGVVTTILLSLAAGAAFGLYLRQFAGNYISTYAGLASVMMALIFLYMLASIFIYGAEVNAVIARARRFGRARAAREAGEARTGG